MCKKKPLIILTGPTAVGKTELSIRLAKAVNAEIISADSMQVYRHMDIGSAKIKPEERQGIIHHLIDVLNPQEEFNVVTFQKMAKEAVNAIYEKGKIPLVVGGTGFYIQALLKDIDFSEEQSDKLYREQLRKTAEEKGSAWLHAILKETDEKAADQIHVNNTKRIIRALEYYHLTGEKISAHNEREREKISPYMAAYFVLTDDREKLYTRIDQRVDKMMEEGLLEEVQRLKAMGLDKSMVSMQGLGYKELLAYLDGELTLEEAVYIIKRDTRHFAKRQITWFKREQEVIWLNRQKFACDQTAILEEILHVLRIKKIIEDKEE
jgi:tRNA dimethylallyltransferase